MKNQHFWVPRGSKLGRKFDQKSIQDGIENGVHLGIEFWKDFHGFWEGKRKLVGTKIASKIDVGTQAEKTN